ncbi:hypothetical protein [uncultured Chryseobacterium sp.]|uniref:XAC2610-related protein n=1 Tax=uncultured Chryseobacterium sp. TaxID=259322 RepID=UPI0025F79BF4|nr:hypothetical protein [uncultured Chryseobacterium sp.]
MSRIFIFILILFIGCNKKTEVYKVPEKIAAARPASSPHAPAERPEADKGLDHDEPDRVKDGNYFKTVRKDNLSVEIFYTVKDGIFDYRHLKVYTGEKIQHLDAFSEWGFLNADEFQLHFEDVNFDGADDITLTKEAGMNWHADRLWINKNGTFIRQKKYEKIKNPIPDKNKRRIFSEYRISGIGEFSETYQWKNGTLVLVNSSEYIYGPDGN